MVFYNKRRFAGKRTNSGFGYTGRSRYGYGRGSAPYSSSRTFKPRNRFTGFFKNGRWYYYKNSTLANRKSPVKSGNRVYRKRTIGQQGLVLQLPAGTQVVNVNTKRKYTKSRF